MEGKMTKATQNLDEALLVCLIALVLLLLFGCTNGHGDWWMPWEEPFPDTIYDEQTEPPPVPEPPAAAVATHEYYILRLPSCLERGRDGLRCYYPSSVPAVDATPLGAKLREVYDAAYAAGSGEVSENAFGRYQAIDVAGTSVLMLVPTSIPDCVQQRYPELCQRLREAWNLARSPMSEAQPATGASPNVTRPKAMLPPAGSARRRG